jgi:hypothetical protein
MGKPGDTSAPEAEPSFSGRLRDDAEAKLHEVDDLVLKYYGYRLPQLTLTQQVQLNNIQSCSKQMYDYIQTLLKDDDCAEYRIAKRCVLEAYLWTASRLTHR